MAARVEEFAIPIRRGSGTLPKQDRAPEAEEEMTKAGEERLISLLESQQRILEKIDERDARVYTAASPTKSDRLWQAVPIVLVCATMLLSMNTRFLGGESSLDKRVDRLEMTDQAKKEKDRMTERDLKLLDSYNRDLIQYFNSIGVRNLPKPPVLGRETQ